MISFTAFFTERECLVCCQNLTACDPRSRPIPNYKYCSPLSGGELLTFALQFKRKTKQVWVKRELKTGKEHGRHFLWGSECSGQAHNRYWVAIFQTHLLIRCRKTDTGFKNVETSVRIWILGGSEGHRYRGRSLNSPRVKAREGWSVRETSLTQQLIPELEKEEDSQKTETIHKRFCVVRFFVRLHGNEWKKPCAYVHITWYISDGLERKSTKVELYVRGVHAWSKC